MDTLPSSATPLGLSQRHSMPPGWRWHSFTSSCGRTLRFGCVTPQNRTPDAIIVGLQGLSEFSEKYFEIAHDMLDRNYSFWMLDWKSQGGSQRLLKNPHMRHSEGFDKDVQDLHDFITNYILPAAVHTDAGRIPLVMLGHSMGGNIGLLYLLKHPDVFACAAFSSPMLGIKALAAMPRLLAWILTPSLGIIAGKRYVFGGTNWREGQRDNKICLVLSSDPVRSHIHESWFKTIPALQVGAVTFRWLYEAYKSCNILQRVENAAAIKTPCLFIMAAQEALVDNDATLQMAAHMPYARVIEIPQSHHEIFMEKDEIRHIFLSAFDNWLEGHTIRDKLKPF